MDQTNLLPPTNLKSYQCVNLSKANKSASKILFFAHSSLIFSKKKQYLVLSFSPRNTEGSQNPRSELSPGKWTSQTKAKSENVFFQDRNTTSKKKKSERTIDAPEHGRSNGTFGCRMNIRRRAAQGICTWVSGKCWKFWAIYVCFTELWICRYHHSAHLSALSHHTWYVPIGKREPSQLKKTVSRQDFTANN